MWGPPSGFPNDYFDFEFGRISSPTNPTESTATTTPNNRRTSAPKARVPHKRPRLEDQFRPSPAAAANARVRQQQQQQNRIRQPPRTTATTTATTTTLPFLGSAPFDYEYLYQDYGEEDYFQTKRTTEATTKATTTVPDRRARLPPSRQRVQHKKANAILTPHDARRNTPTPQAKSPNPFRMPSFPQQSVPQRWPSPHTKVQPRIHQRQQLPPQIHQPATPSVQPTQPKPKPQPKPSTWPTTPTMPKTTTPTDTIMPRMDQDAYDYYYDYPEEGAEAGGLPKPVATRPHPTNPDYEYVYYYDYDEYQEDPSQSTLPPTISSTKEPSSSTAKGLVQEKVTKPLQPVSYRYSMSLLE